MSRLDPIKLLLGSELNKEIDYFNLESWATDNGIYDDSFARFLYGFCVAYFVKLGASDISMARWTIKLVELARKEVDKPK